MELIILILIAIAIEMTISSAHSKTRSMQLEYVTYVRGIRDAILATNNVNKQNELIWRLPNVRHVIVGLDESQCTVSLTTDDVYTSRNTGCIKQCAILTYQRWLSTY